MNDQSQVTVPDFQLSPDTKREAEHLKFGPEMEREFLAYYARKIRETVRWLSIALVALWAGVLATPLQLFARQDPHPPELWAYIFVPHLVFAAMYFGAVRPALNQHLEWILRIGTLIVGGCVVFYTPYLYPVQPFTIMMLFVIAIYTALRLRLVGAAVTSILVTAGYYFVYERRQPDGWVLHMVPLLMTHVLGLLSAYTIEVLARQDFLLTRSLAAEHEKSERLLLSILPETIATQLKAGPKSIADGFAEVTILFADIVDFTPFSAKLKPDELVSFLNEVFSAFDALTHRYGLEKIKTIGDAYLVVGGLPVARADHAEAVAEMALAMGPALQSVCEARGLPLRLRIGINTGPVVAGVIGTKKFIYDLWGDAVNVASRMESHGVAGGIHVSDSTYRQLKDKYRFEERGPLQIKGCGTMSTFLLLGPK